MFLFAGNPDAALRLLCSTTNAQEAFVQRKSAQARKPVRCLAKLWASRWNGSKRLELAEYLAFRDQLLCAADACACDANDELAGGMRVETS